MAGTFEVDKVLSLFGADGHETVTTANQHGPERLEGVPRF
jgi:hypothetical protein